MSFSEALARGARAILDRPLAESEASQFSKYLDLLTKWQKTQRLVGSTDPGWIVDNLFLDSLLFTRLLPDHVRAIADLGSGAGIPGIPVKIVLPDCAVTLIESRQRRASFLAAVVRELGLTGVRIVNARLDEAGADLERAFDAVVMRCAGRLGEILPLAGQLARPGGLVIATAPPRADDLAGNVEVLAGCERVILESPVGPAGRRFTVCRPGVRVES